VADHGIVYITLAHLFYFGVATNAPAIPPLTDREYEHLFPQLAGVGVTGVGAGAISSIPPQGARRHQLHERERHRSNVGADRAARPRDSSDPRDYPVLATDVGMRSAYSDTPLYNLTSQTTKRVQARGGLIGLILAQHQLGSTSSVADSRATLRRHMGTVGDCGDGLRHCALGTDPDGFIKPTLGGLGTLAQWIEEDFPDDPHGIPYGNAQAVLRRVLATRGGARDTE